MPAVIFIRWAEIHYAQTFLSECPLTETTPEQFASLKKLICLIELTLAELGSIWKLV